LKGKKLHDEIYSKHMPAHLEIALDAIKIMSSKWGEVERRLTSEW
jgi:hypothetical protein